MRTRDKRQPDSPRRLQGLVLNTDGACRGNPGPAACGVRLADVDGDVLVERGFYIGRATNNIAEYTGAIRGLELAQSLDATHVLVRSDSQLLVYQMDGRYKIKKAHLKKLNDQLRALAATFESVTFEYVPREENETADRLAKMAVKAKRDVGDLDDR